MPPLPMLSGRNAIKAFERAGWEFARERGSHVILTKAGSWTTLSVPDHRHPRFISARPASRQERNRCYAHD